MLDAPENSLDIIVVQKVETMRNYIYNTTSSFSKAKSNHLTSAPPRLVTASPFSKTSPLAFTRAGQM